jgi:hypothetical protein
MQHFPIPQRLIFLLPLAACLAVCAGARPAWAQVSDKGVSMPSGSNPSSLVGPMPGLKPAPIKPKAAEPDVLPGAATHSDRVTPAQGGPIADPTEALFDAINRGDIASARDAIDRGADLDGRGVLGMTPLDQSVDLGRNDITFLLLSLRNGDTKLTSPASGQTAQSGPAGRSAAGQAAATAKAKASASAKTRMAARAAAKPTVGQAGSTTPAAPVAPRLFAGDGGAPNPAVGFLGFDTRH